MSFTARDAILLKIRQALTQQVPIPFSNRGTNEFVFQPSLKEVELEFAENFSKLQGRFSFCANNQELAQQLNVLVETRKWSKVICKETTLETTLANHNFVNINQQVSLSNCDVAITTCEALVARTGSIFLSSATASGRNNSVYAPVHICIAYTSQLVYDIADGLALIKKKFGDNLPSIISLATGPSRTADIEKTLVVGVHGPKEVFCFLVDG